MYKFSISALPLSEYCRTTTGIYELHEREPIKQTNALGELTEGAGADLYFDTAFAQPQARLLGLTTQFKGVPISGDIRLPFNHLTRALFEFRN